MKKKNLNIFSNLYFDKKNTNINQKQFPNLTRKEIIKQGKYCDLTYKYFLNNLYKKLNKIHNEKFSKKAWEIILGDWLRHLVFFVYKNYVTLDFFVKKKKINKINILKKKNQIFEINSSLSAEEKFNDYNFNLIINSKLVEYFYSDKVIFSNGYSLKYKNDVNKKIFFKLSNFIFLINFFYKFFFFKRRFFISHSYLPFLEEKKLELLLGQLPFIYQSPKINYSNYDISLRNKLNFKNLKLKNFKNFLKINLKYLIPKTIIEDFKQIKALSKSDLFPKKPKFIFSSSLWANDDVFKLFAALNTSKKTPYIIGQHGNNRFTKVTFKNGIDLKICNYYLTWGYKNNKKIKNFFNFKVLNKKIFRKKKDKLLIVLPFLQELHADPNSKLINIVNHIKNLLDNLKNLDARIKKNVILRLPPDTQNKFNINYLDLIKNFNLEFDNGIKPLSKLLKNSKLCLFAYDSTSFLENTLLDIPSIILEEGNFLNTIKKSQLSKYKEIALSNVFFIDKKKLVNFLNVNWDTIDDWWYSSNVKSSINFFNKNLNIKPNIDSLKKLSIFFKKFDNQ